MRIASRARSARTTPRPGQRSRHASERTTPASLGSIVFAEPVGPRGSRADPPSPRPRCHPRPPRRARAGRARRRGGRGHQAPRVTPRRRLRPDLGRPLQGGRCRSAASRPRAGWTRKGARRRLASQSPQEEKVARADVVIDGSAPMEETRRQVERALATLRDDWPRCPRPPLRRLGRAAAAPGRGSRTPRSGGRRSTHRSRRFGRPAPAAGPW